MEAQDLSLIFAQMSLHLEALKKEFQPQLAQTVLHVLKQLAADKSVSLYDARRGDYRHCQIEINGLVSDWLMQLRSNTARRKVYKPLLQAFLQTYFYWTEDLQTYSFWTDEVKQMWADNLQSPEKMWLDQLQLSEKSWIDQLLHSDHLQQKLALRMAEKFHFQIHLSQLYDWLEQANFTLRDEIMVLLGKSSLWCFEFRLQSKIAKLSSPDPELQAWARQWILRAQPDPMKLHFTRNQWLSLWESTPDQALQLKAACMSAEAGSKITLPFLLQALPDADKMLACQIRYACKPHQDPAIRKIWLELLTHPAAHLRLNAAKGLRTFATEPPVQAALMQAWQDPLPEVQLAAAISLARVPETGPQLALWVRQQLDSEQMQPQLMALKVLHKGAVLALRSSLSLLLARVIPLLEADQLRLARKAAFVLGELGSLPAVAPLQAIVANPAAPRALQVTAREALAKIIGPA